MKFKYLLLSFVLVSSLHSCGGDDDVMPVEQEVTDPTNPGGGTGGSGGGSSPNLLACTMIENFNYQVIDGNLIMDWDVCASIDGSIVKYNIDIKKKYWNCDSGGNRFHDFRFQEFSNNTYTLTNVGQLGIYKVYIRAVDVNGHWSTAFVETIQIKPDNGVLIGNLAITNSAFFEFLEGTDIHTIDGDIKIIPACDTGGGLYNFGTLDDFIGLTGIHTITGDLLLTGSNHVTTLEGFETLTTIGGDIVIENFSNLTDVSALNNLTNVNNLRMENLINLTEIDLFNDITGEVGDVFIRLLGGQTINILNNVSSAGNFRAKADFGIGGFEYTFEEITALTNAITIENITLGKMNFLGGFESVTSAGSFSVGEVAEASIETFGQLREVDELHIGNSTSTLYDFVVNIEKINASFSIAGNTEIQSLNLNSVTSTNPIAVGIANNPNLQSITGLNNIMTLHSLFINESPMLNNISFLENVSQIDEDVVVTNNGMLNNIAFLQNLTQIEGNLEIRNNDMLVNLDGLTNLTFIDCPGTLTITDNFNLGNLCGLQNLFVNNGLCSFNATIENNGYNPTPLQIANGDCML